ncbi:MAG: LacI family transcriptional regulator [Bacteroidales bacterium]|jgi:LacI family transcriptional regulator|nr:LacI family transcriptional regulator [Bacteroidales bacterium]MCI1784746.1 LacI family transcriptional regulator [Bacteroidales bacterium]
MKKITIRDVAREAGVSITLVSFVMNAKRDENGQLDCCVNKDTAKRVLEVARRLGYRRNQAAASLRSGRSKTLAVITSDIANPFFAEICRYIENTAYVSDYTVIMASSDEKAEKMDKLIDTIFGYNVEGLIVAPSPGSENVLQRVLDTNTPTVLIDRDVKGDAFGRVMVDNVNSGCMAAEYLIGKGHKKIEMVSYDLGISSFSDREKGYMNAMKKAGLGSLANVRCASYDNVGNDVVNIFKDAVKRGVDAFILPTKSLSVAGFKALNSLGIKYPDDMDFVCFDESDVYEINEPPVAHIVQPVREIGEKAVEVLLNMIAGKKEGKDVMLQAKLFGE